MKDFKWVRPSRMDICVFLVSTEAKDVWYILMNHVYCQGRRNEKRAGGQTLLKGTDKILTMLKSIPGNLEGQFHSSCAKFLPIIFLA